MLLATIQLLIVIATNERLDCLATNPVAGLPSASMKASTACFMWGQVMINITPYTSLLNHRLADNPVTAQSQLPVLPIDAAGAFTGAATESNVSILSRQLSEAAARAETRGAGHLDSISGDGYFMGKAQHDAEVPKTDSLELISRAKQATDFLNGSDSNPFKGLSLDQLSLIARDEGGPFTLNERRAAWGEANSLTILNARASSSAPAPDSRRDLMISRLFNGSEPEVADPKTNRNDRHRNEYLTRDDRDILSQMYAYADSEGADLDYVDNVAGWLAHYRGHDNGRTINNANNGKGYNSEGYMITVNFKEKDAAIASRILNSTAINSTRLDQGFLRHFLDPGQGALIHHGGMAFLEQMVIKFSNEAATQPSLGNEFAQYTSIDINDNIVITVHKDKKLPPFEPLVINDNGVWSVTEKGRAAGYSLDPQTGRARWADPTAVVQQPSGSIADTPAGQRPNSFILEALSGNRNQPDARPIWLSSLFRLIQNYRP